MKAIPARTEPASMLFWWCQETPEEPLPHAFGGYLAPYSTQSGQPQGPTRRLCSPSKTIANGSGRDRVLPW